MTTIEEHQELIEDLFGDDCDGEEDEEEFEAISHPKALAGSVPWWDNEA